MSDAAKKNETPELKKIADAIVNGFYNGCFLALTFAAVAGTLCIPRPFDDLKVESTTLAASAPQVKKEIQVVSKQEPNP